ncbi:MAG: MFS transporter [Myxococcaceae bacterium]|nr:MFS transporter [Myxococcaceae bacterium]MCI0669248.1 MFS transporter [Myxococcaceae bacterium]
MSSSASSARGLAVLRHPDFRLYQLGRLLSVLAVQVESVAIGWQVYALTGSALALGYVGLAQFLPFIAFSLLGGHVADRFDRRKVLAWCHAVMLLCSLALLGLTLAQMQDVRLIYAVLVLFGTARAFSAPAHSALTPHLVPAKELSSAVAVSSTTWQVATIAGPAVGGVLYAWGGPQAAYGASAVGVAAGLLLLLSMKVHAGGGAARELNLRTLLAGVHFVRRERLLLGSITLDLFAVLLGGAVALLPVIARDILHTGPWGLGLLRSVHALGAAVVAVWLAYHPLRRRAGRSMFFAVALFGLATIVFGLSRSLPLSVLALAVLGGADMVSVVVRRTLEVVATPDAMRGRVGAVNMMGVGASNELGEFESGVTAAAFGTVPAVVLGGVGTLLVVGLWAWLFPELRRVDSLERDAAVTPELPSAQDAAPAAG